MKTPAEIRAALRRAINALRDLDLHKLRERIRAAKAQRRRKKAARKGFQHERDEIREDLEQVLDHIDEAELAGEPVDDLRAEAHELEHEMQRLDDRAEELHTVITRRTQLLRRLKPKNLKRTRRRHELAERIRERRRRLRQAIKDNNAPAGPGFTTLDGKQVPNWIAKILIAARAAGVWDGYTISAFRTPAFSIQLCMNMCGRPACPGLCGGAASNHACPPSHTGADGEGAVDVTDPEGLQQYCRDHNLPLHGNGEMLPGDRPHFSRSGR